VKRAGFTVLLGCVMAVGVGAKIGPPVDIDGIGKHGKSAEQVVVATIVEVETAFDVSDHGDQLIVSHALVQVGETMKGTHSAALQVMVEGGTVGDLTLEVSDMPSIEIGERAVFFLDRRVSGTRKLHGRGLGMLKLDANDRIEGTNLTLEDVRRAVRAAGQ
jgi:hypothetical protein